jgi:hypothetical protein
MTLGRAMRGVALVSAIVAPLGAQQATLDAHGTMADLDSISMPFIPGGHWLATRPASQTAADALSLDPVTSPAISPDGIAYFARPNGSLLRPDTRVYQLTLKRDTTTIPLGIRTVTVTESMLGGVVGWLLAESRTGTPVATADSLFLLRADLTPQRWAATIGRAQLAVSFTPDSMFAALQDYRGRSSFSAAVPPGALITPGMIERVVEMLPLAAGYRSAATVVQVESGTPRAVPASIAVVGTENVLLSDRTVDCWVVALRAQTTETRLWVSRDAARVVKSEQLTSGGVLTGVLQE